MYAHILVPVAFDDGPNAVAALAVTQRLADADCRVTLLHVMDHIPGYAITYIPEGFQAETRKSIVESLGAMGADLPNATGVVIEGHAAKSILSWAENNDVDCIVITSQRPGMQGFLLGSTTAQVVRQARCAVHVAR